MVGVPVHVPPVGVGGVILAELPLLHERLVQLLTVLLKQFVEPQFEPVYTCKVDAPHVAPLAEPHVQPHVAGDALIEPFPSKTLVG